MTSKELSIVARYDDLLRAQLPLFDFQEPDWLNIIDKEIKVRKTIRSNTNEVDKLKKDLSQETNERKKLEFLLVQVRRELEEEMRERQKAQSEADQLARQMQVIKEIVGSKNNQSYNMLSEEDRQKLAFLNNSYYTDASPSAMDTALMGDSLSLLSDSEYDKTGDDLIVSRRRRSKRKSQRQQSGPQHVLSPATLRKYPKAPTAPPESEETDEKTSPKRPRMVGDDETDDSLRPPQTEVKLRRSNRLKMRRSRSVGDPIDPDDQADSDSFFDIETGRRIPLPTNTPRSILKKATGSSSPSSYSAPDSPTLKRWASAGKLDRKHNLFQKSVVKPETCTPCGKKIKFGKQALKCKECKLAAHLECKSRLSSVCIPIDTTPAKGSQGNRIIDFAPSEPPFVPGIVLQCVNEVESRGLCEEGIYRKSGSDKEVKELKDRFMKGKDPKLELVYDIHVVCGCLKDFLRNLKEPLIPTSLWMLFVDAAKLKDNTMRYQSTKGAVKQLPAVNKDCISFLILHLQRVSEWPKSKMSIDNLAKVFGPTIVGYSIASPEPTQMISETRPQQMVMTALLELDVDYWSDILAGNSSEVSSLDYDLIQTPEQRTGRNGNQYASVQKSTAKVKKFFGESPRYPSAPSNKTFFPSPMLK